MINLSKSKAEYNFLIYIIFSAKLVPLAYGIMKLSMLCTVEDEKVSIDDLSEKICEIEDYVSIVKKIIIFQTFMKLIMIMNFHEFDENFRMMHHFPNFKISQYKSLVRSYPKPIKTRLSFWPIWEIQMTMAVYI